MDVTRIDPFGKLSSVIFANRHNKRRVLSLGFDIFEQTRVQQRNDKKIQLRKSLLSVDGAEIEAMEHRTMKRTFLIP
jgi:hypothetical protein